MARLQKESVDSMSLRLQEVIRLKERITRDESRLDEIINILLETRVRDKDCVKNRVKRAKIVRFTLC